MSAVKISDKQAHVLTNINRVLPLAAKLRTTSTRPRYQLDGVECTAQITGLTIRRLICRHSNGGFARLNAPKAQIEKVGDRQQPSPDFVAAIRALMSA